MNNNPLLFKLSDVKGLVNILPKLEKDLSRETYWKNTNPELFRPEIETTILYKITMINVINIALKVVPKKYHNKPIFAPAISYDFFDSTNPLEQEHFGGLPDLSQYINWLKCHSDSCNKPFNLETCIRKNWPRDGYDGEFLPFIVQITSGPCKLAWHHIIQKKQDWMYYSSLRYSSNEDDIDRNVQKFCWSSLGFKDCHPCYDVRELSWNLKEDQNPIPNEEIQSAILEFTKKENIKILPQKSLINPTFHLDCIDYDLLEKLSESSPIFNNSKDFIVLGSGRSQQEIYTPYSTSHLGLPMCTSYSWDDTEHDITHQLYSEPEPNMGFWTYGKASHTNT